jgi:hypothetical protein
MFKGTLFNHLNNTNCRYSLGDTCTLNGICEEKTAGGRTVEQRVISFLYVIVANARMTK